MSQIKKIFIIGSSRSGTTMMSRILGNHSEIFSFNELHFFEQVILPDNFTKPLTEIEAKLAYSKLINIQRNGLFDFLNSKEKMFEEVNNIPVNFHEQTGVMVFDQFLAYKVSKHGKKFACEQTPTNIFYINHILEAYPDALFIHMIRDPRAVLLSQKNRWKLRFQGSDGTPLRQSIRNYANYHPITNGIIWKSSVSKGLKYESNPRFFTFQFEKLLADPENTIKEICSFINVPYEETMLQIPQVGSSNNIDEKDKLGIRTSVKDQWKNGGLTKGEIFINQIITKKVMRKTGYQLIPFRALPLSTFYVFLIFPFKICFSFFLNIGRVKNIKQVVVRRLTTET